MYHFNFILLAVVCSSVGQENVHSSTRNLAVQLSGLNNKNAPVADANKAVLNIAHAGREGVSATVFTEGGETHLINTQNANKSSILPQTNPIQMDPSSSQEGTHSKKQVVHGRKGAILDNSIEISHPKEIESPKVNAATSDANSVLNQTITKSNDTSSTKTIPNNPAVLDTLKSTSVKTTTTMKTTTTKKPLPKKPLYTKSSYDTPPVVTNENKAKTTATTVKSLTNETSTAAKSKLEEPVKSSTPMIAPVIEEPSEEKLEVKNSFFKSYLPSKSSYVIPIVIPLFALPLLVLIGRHAIRRGKEAWRNRHYRRMDFLIDGMYND